MNDDSTWNRVPAPRVLLTPSKTLGETIYALVEAKKVQSEEFQTLLKYFGREKIAELYKAEREKHKKG